MLYEEQLNEVEKYKELTTVIAITLIGFHFFPSAAYRSCYGLREVIHLTEDIITLLNTLNHFYKKVFLKKY